jgi:membrane protein
VQAPVAARRHAWLPGALIGAFERNQLLVYASAISFQIFTAIVPVLLFVFGLLGALDLREVWQEDVRPELSAQVSRAVLTVADDTVSQVFDSKQLFWITGGAALAVWQVSGGVRAAMDAMNLIYGCKEHRPRLRRYALSTSLAVAMIALGLVAAADVALLPVLLPEPGAGVREVLFVARWGVAAGLLCLAVGLLVHQGPARPQPLGWVSVGTLLVVGGWTALSGGLLVYLTTIAAYGSLFGNLATIVVLAGYVYAGATVFLAGVQVDALLREHHDEDLGAMIRG